MQELRIAACYVNVSSPRTDENLKGRSSFVPVCCCVSCIYVALMPTRKGGLDQCKGQGTENNRQNGQKKTESN